MPLTRIASSIAASFRDALQQNELERADHLAEKLLRMQREQVEGLLRQARSRMMDNPCRISDAGYRQRDYRVTAIVSTYKAERFMAGRLTDLLEQSIADRLEILVIDSASPQGEREIVAEFQQHADNIRYLRTERRETIYQAWNRGVALSSGCYLTNANTDDRLKNDALEQLCAPMDRDSHIAVTYSNALLTPHDNETFGTTSSTRKTSRPPFSLNGILNLCITGSQPLWRKELHRTLGGFDIGYASAADYDFFIRASRQHAFQLLPEPLALIWYSSDTYSGTGLLPITEFHAVRARYRHLLQPTGRDCSASEEREAAWSRLLAAIPGTTGEQIAATLHDPLLCYRLGRYYEQHDDPTNAWRFLQRAFHLAPEHIEFKQAMEQFMTNELREGLQDVTRRPDAFSALDPLQTMALVSLMTGFSHSGAWLYFQSLVLDRDNAVSQVNLERSLAAISKGVHT